MSLKTSSENQKTLREQIVSLLIFHRCLYIVAVVLLDTLCVSEISLVSFPRSFALPIQLFLSLLLLSSLLAFPYLLDFFVSGTLLEFDAYFLHE